MIKLNNEYSLDIVLNKSYFEVDSWKLSASFILKSFGVEIINKRVDIGEWLYELYQDLQISWIISNGYESCISNLELNNECNTSFSDLSFVLRRSNNDKFNVILELYIDYSLKASIQLTPEMICEISNCIYDVFIKADKTGNMCEELTNNFDSIDLERL